MSSESPNAVLCDINGNELSVQNATAIPANTPALIAAGSDGTNSRYITLDTSGRQIVVGAAAAGAAAAGNPNLVAGNVTTLAPTGYSNATVNYFSLDTSGNLRVTGVGGTFPVTQSTSPWIVNTTSGNFNNASLAGVGSGISADVTSMGALTATNNPPYTTNEMEPLSMNLYGNVRVATQPGIFQDNVQTNATITSSGSLQLLNIPIGTVYVYVSVGSAPTGTTPTLQYSINDLDPQSGSTIFPASIGQIITALGSYVFQFNNTSNQVNLVWAVGGSSPSFTGVYTTIVVSPSVTAICAQTPENTTSWSSGTGANTTLAINVAGYNTVAVTIFQGTTITGGVVTFEVSDTFAGTTWYPINTISANNTYTLVANTNASFQINISGFVQFRVRLSTAISGTASIQIGIAASTATADTTNTTSTVAGAFDTTNPLPISGDLYNLQVDQGLNLRNFPGIQFATGAVWTSATALNTLQYANGTITLGQLGSAPAVILQLDQTTTITGGAATFEGTYDGINWVAIPTAQILNPNTLSTTFQNPYPFTASTIYPVLILLQGYVAIRMHLTTVITGTGSVTPYWAQLPVSPIVTAFTSINNATAGYSTLGTLNSTVVLYTPGLQSVGMQLSAGTFIGTLVAETTYDNGNTWNSVSFINNSTNLTSTQLVFATANGAVGATISEVGGAAQTRVRVSAYTSGTVQCLLSASNITPHLPVATVDLYGNAARISLLGSQLVNQPYRLVGTNFVGTTIDASFWTSSVVGTGTAAQTGGIVTLTTGATNPSDAALTSSRLARYIPGNPNRFRSVILIPTVVITGSTRTWGAYNSTTQPTPTDGFAFSLSAAGVLSVNHYNNGTATTVSSGSFNGQIANSSTGFTTGGTFTMDTNAHTYEIMYIEDFVQFYIDNVLLHTFTVAATPLSSTFNLKFNAVAAGTGTTASMQVWTGLILRDGLAETSPNFSNLGVTAGTQLKLGPGNLQRIILNATSSATTVSVYDAIGAATLPIALISTPAGATPNQLQYEVDFVLGLWVVTTGASSNVTVIYE